MKVSIGTVALAVGGLYIASKVIKTPAMTLAGLQAAASPTLPQNQADLTPVIPSTGLLSYDVIGA